MFLNVNIFLYLFGNMVSLVPATCGEKIKGFKKGGEVCLEQIIDRTGRRLVGKGEIFIGEGYWEIFGCRKWGVLFNMIS